LEKLQAEIARMEEEAARITKETEALEKKKEANSASSGAGGSGGAASGADKAARDGCVFEAKVHTKKGKKQSTLLVGIPATNERDATHCREDQDPTTGPPPSECRAPRRPVVTFVVAGWLRSATIP